MPRTREPGIYARFERHADKTFGTAAAKYLADFQGKDKRRVATAIESTVAYIGHLPLIDVDDEAMATFKDERRRGVGPFANKDGKPRPAMVGTINKELTQVVTILNKACKVWRWIPSAPKLEHVRGAVKQAYPLSWEEQDRLFSQLPTGWSVGVGCFAINTGCRKEEIFGLKWTDRHWVPELDIKDAEGNVRERMFVFVLHGDDTKNGEGRAVICNSIARRAVRYQDEWQEKYGRSDFVFPSKASNRFGSKCNDSGKTWSEAWKRAGLPSGPLVKRGIHNCRHTFAHRLRAADVPEEDRNALLGHARTNLAQHYALPSLERLLAHAEKVAARREVTVLRAVR